MMESPREAMDMVMSLTVRDGNELDRFDLVLLVSPE